MLLVFLGPFVFFLSLFAAAFQAEILKKLPVLVIAAFALLIPNLAPAQTAAPDPGSSPAPQKNEVPETEPVPAEAASNISSDDKGASSPRESWLPQAWKIAVVSAGAGALVLLFGYLQFREIRRRKSVPQKQS